MKLIIQSLRLLAFCFTIIVTLVAAIDPEKFSKSDKGDVYYIENEYQFDWYESLVECARLNMSLLSLESKSKTADVNAMLAKKFNNSSVVLWMGGYAVGPARQYTWVSSGDRFTYSYWCYSNPDFYNKTEYCAQLGYTAQWGWNDNTCSKKFGFVCEYQRKSSAITMDNQEGVEKILKFNNYALKFVNNP